jgi:HlyD family secretion protein
MSKKQIGIIAAVVVVIAAAAWFFLKKPGVPEGLAASNGRLESTDYYISAKRAGRIAEVLADEGDTVEAGQVVARMDTEELEAAIRQAQASIVQAEAEKKVAAANKGYAAAQVSVRKADYEYAASTHARSQSLVKQGAVSTQEAEVDLAHAQSSKAEVLGAQAQVAQAQSQIDAADAKIVANQAQVDRLQAELKDAVLTAPIRGRIERRLAEPGEVLASGGRVLSLLDLSDVYMYIFLPTEVAGKVQLGSEGRIVLDAAPNNPIRATVSFVSPEAQFTPKTVETAEERFNLTFRVKLQLDKNRLREFEPLVKSGIPGMGYVRTDHNVAWPADLTPKGPPSWVKTGSANAAGAGESK